MAANAYLKSFDLTTADWQPLASASLVANVSIWAIPGNIQLGSTVRMRFNHEAAVNLPFNERIRLEGVDLSELEVQWDPANGVAGVLVIGNTR